MTNSNPASGADKSPRILVADDTDVNQKIAQLILQRADYDVDIAANGQEAVQAHQQNVYDLILMDIQMPIMDGHEATQRIRDWECEVQNKPGDKSDSRSKIQNPKSEITGVPIIAMTGNAGTGAFDERLYPAMNDCVGKPLQMDVLLSVVQKWINAESNPPEDICPADKAPVMESVSGQDQNPLDMDRAIEEFMGQKEILLSVLQKFLTNAGSQIDRIRQAVKEADYGAIESNAHAIKGAAANLTADKLADLAADMEQAADKQQSDLSAELADELEQEYFALKKYIQQIPQSG
ncbi:hypothetical protein D1AOALGA4SA_9122 [Olavius algarvensis Delta 1 endosymbiont]|nr:hypothetical protein D1AOALGA4SA_9122 [Olavius algarvensis Delta 1 endosymbiont]